MERTKDSFWGTDTYIHNANCLSGANERLERTYNWKTGIVDRNELKNK